MVLAAVAITNALTVDDLYKHMMLVLDGLIDAGVCIASVSCDGTVTERQVQHRFTKTCTSAENGAQRYSIPHPNGYSAPLNITIPVYRDQPIVMLQDSKHMAKTFRNNAFSGARSLVLGNYLALFQDFAKLCANDGPMYKRDFFKLDRQDDNAALRFLSSGSLKHMTEKHPDLLGPAMYLFVCGELVDAYQNRRITHDERVKMVFRARFFFDIWEKTLRATGHALDRHCISNHALDIVRIACDGLVSLVCVYRDHTDGSEPFLPWLHSTEVCEHIFAELRKIIKDFTEHDVMHLIASIEAMLRAAMDAPNAGDPHSCAVGYQHTWIEQHGVNLGVLSIFPSHLRVIELASTAWQENLSVWDALGVCVVDIEDRISDSDNTNNLEDVRLPSFLSSFPADRFENELESNDFDDNLGDDTETTLLAELVGGEEALPGLDTGGRLLKTAALTLLAEERVLV
jgi:hypothetical protein